MYNVQLVKILLQQSPNVFPQISLWTGHGVTQCDQQAGYTSASEFTTTWCYRNSIIM